MWILVLIIRQFVLTQIQVFKLDLIVYNTASLINLNRCYETNSSSISRVFSIQHMWSSHAKLGKLDQAMTGKGYIDRNPDGKVDRTIIYPDGKIDQT